MWRTNWGDCFSSCRLAVHVLPRATCFPACMHIVSSLRLEASTHAHTHTHAHRLRNRITACGAEASNSRTRVCARACSAALTLHGRQDCEELKEDLDEDEYESTKQAKILNVSSLVALHSKYTRTLTVEKF